jgi:hypothetical protein
MNERIKKLLEQATKAVDPENRVWVFSEVDQAKFAELIVRECADIAKHHVMNISTYGDAEFVDEQIKEHFGVEE